MRVVCVIEGYTDSTQDELVHIFRANDWEDAFARTLELGRGHEQDYTNGEGELVRWRLDRILTLDRIRARKLDGAEVFSSMSEVSGGPSFDAEFNPEAHEPGNTGI